MLLNVIKLFLSVIFHKFSFYFLVLEGVGLILELLLFFKQSFPAKEVPHETFTVLVDIKTTFKGYHRRIKHLIISNEVRLLKHFLFLKNIVIDLLVVDINVETPFIIQTPRTINIQEFGFRIAPVVDVDLEVWALTFKLLQQSVQVFPCKRTLQISYNINSGLGAFSVVISVLN